MGLLIGSLVCAVFTRVLFGDVYVWGFLFQMILMAVFLIFSLAVTLFFSSLFRNQLAAGGLSISVILAVAILSIIPNVGHFLPGGLINWGNRLVLGTAGNAEWITLILTILLIALSVFGAWLNLKRKEL